MNGGGAAVKGGGAAVNGGGATVNGGGAAVNSGGAAVNGLTSRVQGVAVTGGGAGVHVRTWRERCVGAREPLGKDAWAEREPRSAARKEAGARVRADLWRWEGG